METKPTAGVMAARQLTTRFACTGTPLALSSGLDGVRVGGTAVVVVVKAIVLSTVPAQLPKPVRLTVYAVASASALPRVMVRMRLAVFHDSVRETSGVIVIVPIVRSMS